MKTFINSILILSPFMKNSKIKEEKIIVDFYYNCMDGHFIMIGAMLITSKKLSYLVKHF